ncbi:MAG: LPS assembly protein LptD [Proteobacteria bacterium]|nr:LPS assembly protein LptD [Pseudomonadota bacterium]
MKAIAICAIVTAAQARSIEILNIGFKHLAWLGMLLATAATADESLCIIPPLDSPPESQAPVYSHPMDGQVKFRAREGRVNRDGKITVTGDVEVRMGERFVRTNQAQYDPETESFSISGDFQYLEPGLSISGSEGRISGTGKNIEFKGSEFVLTERPARGSASEINISEDQLLLRDIVYTTCPEGTNDWTLRAKSMEIDQEEGWGVARNVQIRFGKIPVFYFPYLSFPVSDKRRSGFLLPTFGRTERSGTEFGLPYYWNIAPNYDLTYTPMFMSTRGWQQNVDFRYLSNKSRGTIELEYLGKDKSLRTQRSYGLWKHNTTWNNGWRATTHIEDVSDRTYFEDFGRDIDTTSRTHLERNVQLDYVNDNWRISTRAQNFRTIDPTLADDELPYERLPQILVRGQGHTGLSALDWQLDLELVNFHRDTGVTGKRMNLRPGLSFTLGSPSYYLTPSVAWDYTTYDLDNTAPGQERKPTRSTPIFTMAGGLVFERTVKSKRAFVQTLEPRIFYAHIPFRNQNDLPVFDSELPTFNTIELFRANRFIGIDRLGETDQVSIGVTTRILDESEGRQVLSATLGQAFFLSDRQITLPGQAPLTSSSSQLIAELNLALYRQWNLDLVYQWDPETNATAISRTRVQYLPTQSSVINVMHRYQKGVFEEADFSFVLPFTSRWSLLGRLNYSLRDNTTLERLVGLEYQSCCWGLQLVSRKFISRRSGESDSSFILQIELKGLSKIGSRASNVLKNGILGYPGN